jgi:hypothetical protein
MKPIKLIEEYENILTTISDKIDKIQEERKEYQSLHWKIRYSRTRDVEGELNLIESYFKRLDNVIKIKYINAIRKDIVGHFGGTYDLERFLYYDITMDEKLLEHYKVYMQGIMNDFKFSTYID